MSLTELRTPAVVSVVSRNGSTDASTSRIVDGPTTGGTGVRAAVANSVGVDVPTALRPASPDVRITLTPVAPRISSWEKVDSMIGAHYRSYSDSVRIVESWRAPGDWTVQDKRGRRWGWDTVGLKLGGIEIHRWMFEPWFKHQVLRVPTGTQPEARDREQIRRDVMAASQVSQIRAEQKSAVARVRARADSLRRLGDPRAPIPEFAAAPR